MLPIRFNAVILKSPKSYVKSRHDYMSMRRLVIVKSYFYRKSGYIATLVYKGYR